MISPAMWITEFLAAHRLRFNPGDWPARGTLENKEFVRLWIEAFKDEDVSEQEANTASIRLGTAPPRFRLDHLPAVIAVIRQSRAQVAAPKYHVRGEQTSSPLPPPPRFASWRKWVKAGCPEWDDSGDSDSVQAAVAGSINRQRGPDTTLTPLPARSSIQ